MGKRCPPGVICIENITFIYIIFFIFVILFYLHKTNRLTKNSGSVPSNNIIKNIFKPNDTPDDVYSNPYRAPLKDNFINDNIKKIPINVKTQSVTKEYKQLGILTRVSKGNMDLILPLMGRPLIANRDKWNFYSMSDQNHSIKLPISHNGKSCTNEYGCDNLYNGDIVYVEGYNDAFKVTMYENEGLSYIPIL